MTQQNAESLDRPRVESLDAILGKTFPVLNGGFVRLIDYMGDEGAICQAARVSYGKGTKKVSQDAGLLRYLMRHFHSTPFEMCEVKLHVRIPMDAWRQMVRHRTASINEYSTRYSEAIDAADLTPKGGWRTQAKNNKQGSGENLAEDPTGLFLSVLEEQHLKRTHEVYKRMLDTGVAREQARKVLSLSTYTEAYWKVDLKNLLGFLALRMDSHAQKEIRDYADVIGEQIVAAWLPTVWEAFNDYHPLRDALTLTRLDCDVIRAIGGQRGIYGATPIEWPDAVKVAANHGWLKLSKKNPHKLVRNRERSECETKLKHLGLPIPWAAIHVVRRVVRSMGGASPQS